MKKFPFKKYRIHIIFAAAVVFYAAYLIAGFAADRRLIPTASRFADYFYINFNVENYAAMYRSTTLESCDCSIKLEGFRELMERVMSKLGKAWNWRRTGFTVVNKGNKKEIAVSFLVEREQGQSRERLVLIKSGNQWQMVGYQIDSDKLKE